ncbi:MAG: hypothetical protein CSA22_06200 [Deltaproteobacteria bacterium]|nr:MAG: hypothetical protein CSA22_06200 [Deltaproteobacteria bacterium]
MDPGLDFLIVGAGRSGTSLLAGLVDAHPEMAVGFEVGGTDGLRGKAIPEHPETLLADRVNAFCSMCAEASAKSDVSRWGNKITTEQIAGLNRHNLYHQPAVDVLAYFFNERLSNIPVIYLLRDGRACVRSKLARTGQSLEQACKHWQYAVRVYRFLRNRPQVHCMRFETLVTSPEQALRGVCDFLGVAYDPAMRSGTDSCLIPAPYRQKGVDASRSDAGTDPDHPCVPLISDALADCGYC